MRAANNFYKTILLLLLSGLPANAEANFWVVTGADRDGIPSQWVQLGSYEPLNADSFRVVAKLTYSGNRQVIGKIDLNCKNKDYYWRPQGIRAQTDAWRTIEAGTGIQQVGAMFCKNTAAAETWGFTSDTENLWKGPAPKSEPESSRGEWVLATDNDEREVYYNNDILKKGDTLQIATWTRLKKGERLAGKAGDPVNYQWIKASCSLSKSSAFYKPDPSLPGTWLPPLPIRPGGIVMQVKRDFC
jgi:hypothetical protein